MDSFLGIGIPEILLVLILALIVMGPRDMVSTARNIGRWIYRITRSETWRTIRETSQELRNLPTEIIREAGVEETMKEVKGTLQETQQQISSDLAAAASDTQAAMAEAGSEINTSLQAVQEADGELRQASSEAVAQAGESQTPEAAAGEGSMPETVAPVAPARKPRKPRQPKAASAPQTYAELREAALVAVLYDNAAPPADVSAVAAVRKPRKPRSPKTAPPAAETAPAVEISPALNGESTPPPA